jgi:release factor glutamine methyltransferase
MHTRDALKYLQTQLHPMLGEYSVLQSEQILQHIFRCSRPDLYLKNLQLSAQLETEMTTICNRRLSGEPLPYILNAAYFYNREFFVDSSVLIPRPDTEILIEQILANEQNEQCFFADIGTGSGIIACILTEQRKKWRGVGLDIAIKSLKVAKKNAQHGAISFVCTDMLSGMKPKPVFDFIASNPPYISESEICSLDRGVKDFEPYRALYGGKDGLDFYRYLASNAKRYMRPAGKIYCEIGYNQKDPVCDIFKNDNWNDISIIKDLAKNHRVLIATKG